MHSTMKIIALAAFVAAGLVALGPPASAETAYPGGTWEPGPPRYGVVSDPEVRFQARDGVELAATVAYPADLATGERVAEEFPVIVQFSNAAPSSPPGRFFVERGYIYAVVEYRHMGRSGGNPTSAGPHLWSPQMAMDAADAVNWAAGLDGSTGVVGMRGCSNAGGVQVQAAMELGPGSPLKAIVPEGTTGDFYRYSLFDNGIPTPLHLMIPVLGLALAPPTGGDPTDPPPPLNEEWPLYHPFHEVFLGQDMAYHREYYDQRDFTTRAPEFVASGVPALFPIHWSEGQSTNVLELWAAIQNSFFGRPPYAPMVPGDAVTGRYQLLVGNQTHCAGWDLGVSLQWFETWLKQVDTGIPLYTTTPLHLREVPSGRWVNLSTYPIATDHTPYYLGPGGTLAPGNPPIVGNDTLVWAPSNVAILDQGATAIVTTEPAVEAIPVVYTTEPFADATTFAGPSTVTVYASSSNSNLQLVAELLDVAPDDTETRVTGASILGSLRAQEQDRNWFDAAGRFIRPYLSLLADDYAPAGQIVRYDIPVPAKLWSLAAGHRLRLRLSTQAKPQYCSTQILSYFDKVGCIHTQPMLDTLPGGIYQVFRGGVYPSSLSLPLLPPEALQTAASGATPTSNGIEYPSDWGSGPPDVDLDGVPDVDDNCPFAANPGQEDTGGLATSTPDGIGNACQCGDVTGNGIVNGQDANVIKHRSTPLFAVPGNCDVTGNDQCNGQDANAVKRAALGLSSPEFGQNCHNATGEPLPPGF